MANEAIILSKFESFNIFTVSMAGFLDGINPCAFTTIVFFISFLAFAGYGKREMITAGIFFITAVFAAYLMIGLGIFKFLRSLSAFSHMALVVNIVIGSIAFLLGVLNIIDYVKFRKTNDTSSASLKLPQSIKNKIHSIIGADFRKNKGGDKKALIKIAWIAFGAGFMVSILESVCTGQVYLPTIAYVLRIPDRHIPALAYLLIYNIVFIAPLIIVFILGLFGTTSGIFSRFMQRQFGFIKLATAALFFALGAILIILR
jgi:hypothetical protein